MSDEITGNVLELFLAYARDAGNWSGTPLVGGNVSLLGEREDRGLLSHLKQAGLITTWEEREPGHARCTWLDFTAAGEELATEHGIYLGKRNESAGQRELLAELRQNVAETIAGYQDRQGWSDTTTLSVLADFIETHGHLGELRAYLRARAVAEDNATALPEYDDEEQTR